MRILVIEDSRKVLDSLHLGLTRSGYEVATATNGALGLRIALSGSYDVVILDLLLPELSGLEVLKELRSSGSSAQVLILTALGAVEDRVRGLQHGADDYLSKPFSFDELLARVQALTRRKFGQKMPVIQVGELEIDTVGRTVRCAGHPITLTNREFRLLEILAYREGETVSRMEIEEHLYGSRNLPLSNVVNSAICNIRSKLKEYASTPLIHTRPRLGFVLSAECP